jgi:hypothetical protein
MHHIYRYEDLGSADHGWLTARYHFSFADYDNPRRRSFGALRVINDDRIAPHSGFGRHPHANMEIVTFVRQGAITHEDSLGNVGRTAAGDVQVMSAGTGVFHAEYNREEIPTRLFQIWITPNQRDVAPRWEAREFPKETSAAGLTILVSGRQEHEGTGALWIHQDAVIWGGRLAAGSATQVPIRHQAYILVSEGHVRLGSDDLKAGDGAEVTRENHVSLTAQTESEILVLDVPN